jgi:hypothetical protein
MLPFWSLTERQASSFFGDRSVKSAFLCVLVLVGLSGCGNEADPASAQGERATQQARAAAAVAAQSADGATLKGATSLWAAGAMPAAPETATAQTAAPKPARNLAMVPAQERVTPVVHRIVHPSLAARVARHSVVAPVRPGDMVGGRGVEVRPGDKVGMRSGDVVD